MGRQTAASGSPPGWLRSWFQPGRRACRAAWIAAASVLVWLGGTMSAPGRAGAPQAASPGEPFSPTLRMERLAALGQGELLRELPNPADFGVERIVAFEENWRFLYLCGVSGPVAAAPSGGAQPARREPGPTLLRKIFVLKPSTLVIDDQVCAAGKRRIAWLLESEAPFDRRGREILGGAEGAHFRLRPLLPDTVTLSAPAARDKRNDAPHQIRLRPEHAADPARLVCLVRFAPGDDAVLPGWTVRREEGTLRLELSVRDALSAADQVIALALPEGKTSGKVSIFDRKGNVEIPARLLPAGILPLGEAGLKALQRWDLAYRGEGLAFWDIGRPSSELEEAVEAGTLRPCRAVVLGCGTGTNAIYLAGKGFDVTGVDIAPTALRLAEQKAQKAGVKVRWLLADVLRPPELEPFEFLYDRGCYHYVRRHDAKGYLAAVRRLARPGARILILANNANEDSDYQRYGPPRVTEAEIRGDFAEGFKLLWLRERRFDASDPDRKGSLAWSVLLEREADP